MKYKYFAGIVLAVACGSVYAHDDDESEASLEFATYTDYLTSGFSELDHGGYHTMTAAFIRGDISVEFWGATAAAVDYEEANLSLAYHWTLGEWEGDIAYTWLAFYEDEGKSDDTEVTLAFEYPRMLWLPALELVYSSQANGHQATLAWEHDVEWQSNTFIPFAEVGFDFGYLTESYDGANHIGVGGAWQRPLSEHWSVRLELGHIWGLGNMDRADEPDRLWGGMVLSSGY